MPNAEVIVVPMDFRLALSHLIQGDRVALQGDGWEGDYLECIRNGSDDRADWEIVDNYGEPWTPTQSEILSNNWKVISKE